MKKATELAGRIWKDAEKNWLPELELLNLHTIFRPLYKGVYKFEIPNKIVSFVILAYDNDSPWIDPRKDRYANKVSILEGIEADPEKRNFKEILNYENPDVQDVIFKYLIEQTDARWQEIMSLLEYSSKMILFCNQQTTDRFKTGTSFDDTTKQTVDDYEYLNPADVAKANKEKGQLLDQAIAARKKAEELLKSLESDFQKVDAATQGDFGFQFTDVKRFDVMSWEQRVRRKKSMS